jgi:hypothetical protein
MLFPEIGRNRSVKAAARTLNMLTLETTSFEFVLLPVIRMRVYDVERFGLWCRLYVLVSVRGIGQLFAMYE